MCGLFLRHSSQNNFAALALNNWLINSGREDVFINLDPKLGIVLWEKPLHDAATRCDAILFLVSRAWLDPTLCRKEFRLAHHLDKQIIGLLIEYIAMTRLPDELTAHWKLVNQGCCTDYKLFAVKLPAARKLQNVHFSVSGLTRSKTGLVNAGLAPLFFELPPKHDTELPTYRGIRPLDTVVISIFIGLETLIIDLQVRLRCIRDRHSPRLMLIFGTSVASKFSFLCAGILQFSKVIRLKTTREALRNLIETDINGVITQIQQMINLFTPKTLHDETQEMPIIVLSIAQCEERFPGAQQQVPFLTLWKQLLCCKDFLQLLMFTVRSDEFKYQQTGKALKSQNTFSLLQIPVGAYRDVIDGSALHLEGSQRSLVIEQAITERLLLDIEQDGSKDALPKPALTLKRLSANTKMLAV